MNKLLTPLLTLFFSLKLISLTTSATAQSVSMNSGQMMEAFEKLKTNGSVLYIAAHPDDENTRLLTWLVHEKKVRTAYLSLTRGEGGQNLIGSEQGEMLGLLRTQELLAARRIDGAEQFFSRAYDFGYSKSPDETLKLWNHDSILSDVVWVIRKFRPDVIIMRFPTTGEGGHGQHTASAILSVEAFAAAADPSKFPEQLTMVSPWKARRLFLNTFNFGNTNTTSEDQLKVETGQYNSLIGFSYGELAALSRSQHRCQAMGTAADRSPRTEYFKQLAGDTVKTDLLEGIDLSWNRYDKSGRLQKMADSLQKNFDPYNPEASVAGLGRMYAMVDMLNDATWKHYIEDKIKELMIACSGVYFEAIAPEAQSKPGDSATVILQYLERKKTALKCLGFVYPVDSNQTTHASFTVHDGINIKNGVYKDTIRLKVPSDFSFTTPYFLKENRDNNMYRIPVTAMRGLPETKTPWMIRWIITWGTDASFTINCPVQYKWVDPSFGEKRKQVAFVPAVSARFAEHVYVFNNAAPQTITIEVQANTGKFEGMLQLNLPKAWRSMPDKISVSLSAKGSRQQYSFLVTPTVAPQRDQVLEANLIISEGEKTYYSEIDRINYDHIPEQVVIKPATTKFLYAPIQTFKGKIAYFEGAGDEVQEAIHSLGFQVESISASDLQDTTKWKQWTALVTGVRFFNVTENAGNIAPLLLKYAQQGGHLIIQYNTEQGLKSDIPAPYSFKLSRQRVTDENAPVSINLPEENILKYPNVIHEEDFSGWIQELGLYFPTVTDSLYKLPLIMNDPGESPLKTSLVWTNYGKGSYCYTGLSFFRQLPAAVPGAYRLFVNLLNGGRKP